MSIITDIERKLRENPLCGVQFGIDPECYECSLQESRVEFGKNEEWRDYTGTTFNYQPIAIDGNKVGILEEIQPYSVFEPMRISFILPLEKATRRESRSKHFSMNPYDYPEMRFATLQQLIDYLNIK